LEVAALPFVGFLGFVSHQYKAKAAFFIKNSSRCEEALVAGLNVEMSSLQSPVGMQLQTVQPPIRLRSNAGVHDALCASVGRV